MRNVYPKSVWLLLAIFFLSYVHTNAQALNDKFISPMVYRQGQASIMKVTYGPVLYVVGNFDFHGDRPMKGHLVRLKADGLLDTSFNPELAAEYTEEITDLEIVASNHVAFISTK